MISTNALNILAKRQSVSGYKLLSWGAAQNELGALTTLGSHGVKVGQFVNHPLDGVANIVGYNAFTKPNPYRFIGSLVAAPLLGASTAWSPHSLPGGGSYLEWIPWIYDKSN